MTDELTTVSEVLAENGAAAEVGGSAPSVADSPTGTSRARRARTSVAITQGVRQRVVADVRDSWVWKDSPPALKEIIKTRQPDAEQVPGGSKPLHIGWVVWNAIVAVPATAFLYAAAWLLQHPARAALALPIGGAIFLIWIN